MKKKTSFVGLQGNAFLYIKGNDGSTPIPRATYLAFRPRLGSFIAKERIPVISTDYRPPGLIKIITRNLSAATRLSEWISQQSQDGINFSCSPQESQQGFDIRILIPSSMQETEKEILDSFWHMNDLPIDGNVIGRARTHAFPARTPGAPQAREIIVCCAPPLLGAIQKRRRENPTDSRIWSCLLSSLQVRYSRVDAAAFLEKRGFNEDGTIIERVPPPSSATPSAGPSDVRANGGASGSTPSVSTQPTTIEDDGAEDFIMAQDSILSNEDDNVPNMDGALQTPEDKQMKKDSSPDPDLVFAQENFEKDYVDLSF